MKKAKNKTKKNAGRILLWLFIVFLLLIAVSGFLFYKLYTQQQQQSATQNISQSPQTSLLANIAVWYPSAPWSEPKSATQNTYYGKMSGESMSAVVTQNQASISHFEDQNALKNKGFTPDIYLQADGPGTSVWGYKNTKTNQLILFSYSTEPTNSNPNEPVQFNCPCKVVVTVFVSNAAAVNKQPSPTKTTLANPASVNCKKVGGNLLIETKPDGSQYGLCDFGDNMQCEEWALYRGQCPVGGIKTTGYDTTAEKYCAWVGGKTLAVTDAKCTLPNGHVCADDAAYNGTCQ